MIIGWREFRPVAGGGGARGRPRRPPPPRRGAGDLGPGPAPGPGGGASGKGPPLHAAPWMQCTSSGRLSGSAASRTCKGRAETGGRGQGAAGRVNPEARLMDAAGFGKAECLIGKCCGVPRGWRGSMLARFGWPTPGGPVARTRRVCQAAGRPLQQQDVQFQVAHDLGIRHGSCAGTDRHGCVLQRSRDGDTACAARQSQSLPAVARTSSPQPLLRLGRGPLPSDPTHAAHLRRLAPGASAAPPPTAPAPAARGAACG